MVDTRIVIVVDIFVVLLSLGAFWMTVGYGSGYDGFNAFDVASMVGGYIGGQQVNPPSYQGAEFNAYAQAVLPPLMAGSWEVDAAIIALTTGLISAFFSFVRWRLSLLAGALEVIGCLSWVAGISGISQEAGSKLAQWQGFNGVATPISVGSDVGTYIGAAGGVFLIATYLLTRTHRLDTPLDSSLPTPQVN
ncbi:MAG: hypothetical protein JRM80_05970 [Nitrososphaerota archaeon]|nr:hypothetical protein [Nitrososphaerota archaeon]